MHRSGTSCLIGSLQQAGLDLGNHSTWNPFNQLGNRENPGVAAFHDVLLEENGGRWDRLPPCLEWGPHHVARARELLATYPRDRRWGFKDPKTLPALDGWKALLGDMIRIGIFRNPLAVARSLHQRNGLSIPDGLALWADYNRRLLAEHDLHPFPLLSFDWDEETFHQKLNLVLPELGLRTLGDTPEDRFFTRELRHHVIEPDGPELPAEVERLYRILQERTV